MSLKELAKECEEVIAVLDEVSRELDEAEKKLRKCSWKLTSLKDEALKVEEVEDVSLNEGRLDVAASAVSKASARLLRLSERIERASFEVKAFVIECLRLVRE
jgi:uncharacterized coiled-coil DUF342 family protein